MNNNAYGFKAVEKNAGNQNNAFGNEALTNNLNGTGNTAIGHAALRNNTSGSNNNAFGYDALGANEYGISNNAIGYGALKSNRSGSNNIGIGDNAGNSITTGSNNIVIGYTANVPDGTADNQISIGNLIYGIEATNLLGTGKIGIGTVAPTEKLDIDGKVKVRDLVTNATIPTGSQVIIADANGVLAKVDAGGLLPAPTDDEIAAGDTILVWNETERKWGAGKLPTGMQSGDWIYCPPFKLEWEAGKTFDAELNLFTKFSTKLSNKLPNFNSSNYTFELMDFESEGINSIDIDENGGLIYTCTDYEPVYLDFVTIIIVKK
jgi:hypothetical protein